MPLIVRYLAFVGSWLVFVASFTALFLSMRAVLAVGGYCAEGGPYQIETHCPGNTGWLTPVSIWTGLAAVALYIWAAKGLGASLTLLAWPILFIFLSFNFLQAGIDPQGAGLTGILLGVMFLVMGAVPLFAWMFQPGNLSAAVAGTSHIDGRSIGSVSLDFKRRPEPDGPIHLDVRDYLVLVPLWLLVVLAGIWAGVAVFQA
ncbi:MAG: hypothetical protein KF742_05925 [Cryobacterium sp.]|nr:hypothetical protein [Cryobacterium sp.]